MNRKTIKEAYQVAIKESKQPNCPYCEKPLTIDQSKFTEVIWRWDIEKGQYFKDEINVDEFLGDPACSECRTYDDDFLAFGENARKEADQLGLVG